MSPTILLIETVTKVCLLLIGGDIDPSTLFNNVKFIFKKTHQICSIGGIRLVTLFGKYSLSQGSYYVMGLWSKKKECCAFSLWVGRGMFPLKPD